MLCYTFSICMILCVCLCVYVCVCVLCMLILFCTRRTNSSEIVYYYIFYVLIRELIFVFYNGLNIFTWGDNYNGQIGSIQNSYLYILGCILNIFILLTQMSIYSVYMFQLNLEQGPNMYFSVTFQISFPYSV